MDLLIIPSLTHLTSLYFISDWLIFSQFSSSLNLTASLSVSVKQSHPQWALSGSGSTRQAPTAVTYLVQDRFSQAQLNPVCACVCARVCVCAHARLCLSHFSCSPQPYWPQRHVQHNLKQCVCVHFCVYICVCRNVCVYDRTVVATLSDTHHRPPSLLLAPPPFNLFSAWL